MERFSSSTRKLPLAFVVKADPKLTESEIVKFVHEKSSPAKRLRGGVRFIDHIPIGIRLGNFLDDS